MNSEATSLNTRYPYTLFFKPYRSDSMEACVSVAHAVENQQLIYQSDLERTLGQSWRRIYHFSKPRVASAA